MAKKVIVIQDDSVKILTLFAAVAFLAGSVFFTYAIAKDLFSGSSSM